MKIEINCTDIVPIINEAWEKSFLKVKLSKQAIAMHVWNLLKRNLLMDLKILKTKPKSEPTTEWREIEEQDNGTLAMIPNDGMNIVKTVNLEHRFMGTVITNLPQDVLKQEVVTQIWAKDMPKEILFEKCLLMMRIQ